MILVGAGAAGKETSGLLITQSKENIIFFDDSFLCCVTIWDKFKVINSEADIQKEISINPHFCVTIGNPRKRKKLFKRFIDLGGQPKNIYANTSMTLSIINENATILQPGVTVSFDVKIGLSCLIHANSVIGHKVTIGNFCNISPLSSIIGPCCIGNETYVGASSVILPNLEIGNNVYIPAGSIVSRNLKDFETYK